MTWLVKLMNESRKIQQQYNISHNIVPQTIKKEIREVISNIDTAEVKTTKVSKKEIAKTIDTVEAEMKEAAKNLDFERAMELRDILFELKASK